MVLHMSMFRPTQWNTLSINIDILNLVNRPMYILSSHSADPRSQCTETRGKYDHTNSWWTANSEYHHSSFRYSIICITEKFLPEHVIIVVYAKNKRFSSACVCSFAQLNFSSNKKVLLRKLNRHTARPCSNSLRGTYLGRGRGYLPWPRGGEGTHLGWDGVPPPPPPPQV